MEIYTYIYKWAYIHKTFKSTTIEYSVLSDKKYENTELIFSHPYYPTKVTKPVCVIQIV